MVLACAYASLRGESQALLLFPHLRMIFVLPTVMYYYDSGNALPRKFSRQLLLQKKDTRQTLDWQSCSPNNFISNKLTLHETSRHDAVK